VAASDVTPISGYLNFSNGINRQLITITSIDNSLPQPDRMFSVRLVSSSGWTPVSDTRLAVATLTGQYAPESVVLLLYWRFFSLKCLVHVCIVG